MDRIQSPWVVTSENYRQYVLGDIAKKHAYFSKQLTRYRWSRATVIVSAALIPVLSPVDQIPIWVLGSLGAIAAIVESLNQLYRWRDAALAAQQAANALETQVNLYSTSSEPYSSSDIRANLSNFVRSVEAIRSHSHESFAGMWGENMPSTTRSDILPASRPADEQLPAANSSAPTVSNTPL